MTRQDPRDREKRKATLWLKFRIYLTLVFFLLFFTVITVRIANLMLINREKLYAYAEKQHRFISTYITKRGNIYDRNGVNMAVSIEMDSIYACPYKVLDANNTANILSQILSVEEGKILGLLNLDKNFVWLRRRVSKSMSEILKKKDIDGIGFIKEDKRFYPHRSLGCHFIGFVGTDSQGLSGLEYEMDSFLKSTISHYIAFRDARGKKIFELDIASTPALNNYDLVLTVDVKAQYIAERELLRAILESGATGGSAIVMDPYSGEILAMANYPSYDPNHFLKSPNSDWSNKAVSMNFEPGSTFKIFVASGVIEEGLAKRDDMLTCENGEFKVLGTVFHDHGGNFGTLSVADIIRYSSNIGAIKLGMLLGREKFYQYLDDFGFKSPTGISLPGEEKGIIAPVDSINEVDLAAMSFGQGLSVTPLQLITAVAVIANGGLLIEPHIVKRIVGRDNKVVFETRPKIKKKVLSGETANIIREMMVSVVKDGTGTKAQVDGFDVAGKTGTAQVFDALTGTYSETDFIASFVGFIPAESPRFVILVVIEKPKNTIYGGYAAAPAFRRIAKEMMNLYMIFPDEMFERGEELKARGEETELIPLM